jgi:hypothetical protein
MALFSVLFSSVNVIRLISFQTPLYNTSAPRFRETPDGVWKPESVSPHHSFVLPLRILIACWPLCPESTQGQQVDATSRLSVAKLVPALPPRWRLRRLDRYTVCTEAPSETMHRTPACEPQDGVEDAYSRGQ